MELPGERLVIKLWETVAEKGIGGLLRPWQIRREGRASIEVRREEMLMLAQAERQAELIRKGEHPDYPALPRSANSIASGHETAKISMPTIEERANQIAIADTIRKEVNVAKAMLYAEQVLETDGQAPPDEKVDDDWLFRWRENASQISNDKLQELWGRVLAGEIKAPGRYSLRTLDFIKNLSQQEAEYVAMLAPFVIDGAIYRLAQGMLNSAGITFGFLMKMQELGLVVGVESPMVSKNYQTLFDENLEIELISNSMMLVIKSGEHQPFVEMPVYVVTETGMQLLSLGNFEPNIEYLKAVAAHFKSRGCSVKLARYELVEDAAKWFDAQEL
jgi:hypothetical protein